jgi:myoferlin
MASQPLPEPAVNVHHPNELDRLLLQMRKKSIKKIVHKCEKLPNVELKNVLEELENFARTIRQLEKEPQNSIPDIIIWALKGSERVAYYRIPAHEVMYSKNNERKGDLCSRLQTITLKWPGKESLDKSKRDIIPCQVRLKLWFGLEKDERDWIQTHTDEKKHGAISIYAETVIQLFFNSNLIQTKFFIEI